MASLSHPNIVQVFDCGERGGLLYVAEEFVEGGTLAQKMAGLPQPPAEAAQLMETLARAIHYVHQHQIIHRNLKPNVVLLTPLGIPKISSFDLGRLIGPAPEETETLGTLAGTPIYMSPEQAMGQTEAIGPSTDVYALGAILYQLLTGRLPFQADAVVELLQQVQDKTPPPPSRWQPGLPGELDHICLKCLRKLPTERFESALALADALQSFLTRQRQPSLWKWLQHWVKAWL